MKRVVLLCLALSLALTGCAQGVEIVPIESLSPEKTAANLFSAQPFATPEPTDVSPSAARIDAAGMTVATRINPPEGYTRVYAAEDSLGTFLRNYAVRADGAQVLYYNGEIREDAQAAAVLDISLGSRNHEGPAGAMARLISEYLYSQQNYADISFTLGSDFDFTFDTWRQGRSIAVDGSSVSWASGGEDSNGEENFRSYLATLFVYISMSTFQEDLEQVEDVDGDEIRVGDIFLGTTADGKKTALMVADICQSDETGEKLMLLVQGGAPAQQLHIVENLGNADLSPWYPCGFSADLTTPDASIAIENRYRYKNFA